MSSERFARLAWGVLGYNLLVVMFGAFVRATGSGAGCGSHWPLCNGTILQRNPATETIIELTHRLTSGLALLLVIGLVVAAVRTFPRGHMARRGAWVSLGLIIVEALVGAGLVLLKLVADNDSMARAVYLGVHLLNTFLLVAALALTAWWARAERPVPGRLPLGMALACAGLIVVGVSGAITALGDTLFPAGSLAEGFRQDTSPTAHLLVRLRVIHPVFAVAVGLALLGLALRIALRGGDRSRTWLARIVAILVLAQLSIGVINLVLLAPTALQLLHLLFADLVWISAVLLTASLAAEPLPAGFPAAAELGGAAALQR